jgi:hypothetical protein
MRIKLAFFLFLMFTHAYCANQPSIGKWTQNVLMDTFSASYKDTPSEIKTVQSNYLPYAWGPVSQFLRDKRVEINASKLILHPRPLTAPNVVSTNECNLSPCWQVTQSFKIPELLLKINVSLRVIPGHVVKSANTPFMIQSMSLNLQKY